MSSLSFQFVQWKSATNYECISVTATPHHPMMFDEINGLRILKSALKTEERARPSSVDANLWKGMWCSFQSASSELCAALACTAWRTCPSPVDPEPSRPLTARRLYLIYTSAIFRNSPVRYGKNGKCKRVSYRTKPYRSRISRSTSPNVPYRTVP